VIPQKNRVPWEQEEEKPSSEEGDRFQENALALKKEEIQASKPPVKNGTIAE
jgi:hypothetical protein